MVRVYWILIGPLIAVKGVSRWGGGGDAVWWSHPVARDANEARTIDDVIACVRVPLTARPLISHPRSLLSRATPLACGWVWDEGFSGGRRSYHRAKPSSPKDLTVALILEWCYLAPCYPTYFNLCRISIKI